MSLVRKTQDFFPGFTDSFGKEFFNDFIPLGFHKTVPAVNIWEEKEAIKINVAAPGFTKEDFKINLEDHLLIIAAKKEIDQRESRNNYARKEFSYHSFKRSFSLPEIIDTEKITASYSDGILDISIGKKEEVKQKEPKQINIK